MTTAAQAHENLPQHAVHEIQQARHACQQWDKTMADYLQNQYTHNVNAETMTASSKSDVMHVQ